MDMKIKVMASYTETNYWDSGMLVQSVDRAPDKKGLPG